MSGPNRLKPMDTVDKEPLRTGHSGREGLIERCRIGRDASRFGHGVPLFVQALLYLTWLAILALVLAWAFRS
jgi:hypothetical protein